MGMYDELYGLDLKCPAGHALDGFQTKDLDCQLEHYTLTNGKLVSRDCAIAAGPGTLYVYTHCKTCPSEYGEGGNGGYWLGLWCDFTITLDANGRVTAIERCEPREI